MRLSKEQIIKDDERFAKRDIMEELRWCSVEVGDRVHITNDDLHFFAFVARKAYELLKEKQPLSPVWDNEPFSGRAVWFCPNCNEGIDKFAFGRNLSITHCPYCGQALDWKDGDGE